MTPITIERITRSFGTTVALDDVSLRVTGGEVFFLLGPSGCGKTTLLRIVAGLEMADRGRILLGDRDVTRMPARLREAVMVFQGYALWPHMSVEKNVGFGLDVRGVPSRERRAAVALALEQVKLSDLAGRKPGQLSGGQQQRVALARALVVKPRVLLLDEPLSNLDAGLRIEMRDEIRGLCREAGLTALYVTHDQHEAMAIADRIALMRDGRIEQVGSPREIYDRPASHFAARFMGDTNLFAARIHEVGMAASVDSAFGILPAARLHEGARPGDRVTCSVRPACVTLSHGVGAGVGGTVKSVTFLGERTEVKVEAGDTTITVTQGRSPELRPGDEVCVTVVPDCLVILPDGEP